jgi:hypothetical protein
MRALLAACAGIVLLTAPATLAAQDASAEAATMDDGSAAAPTGANAELAAITDMFSGMFIAEPLDPEQEARLPAAQQLIAKVIPEGTMAEMMDKVFDGLLGPMMAQAPSGAATTLARQLGLSPYEMNLDDQQVAELASLFDPAWEERQQREMATLPDMMKDIMGLMEPGMRKAMAELYAIRFSADELAEIDAFFSTGTGGKYARESFLMASDPRIMASTMEAMPALMGSIGDMEKRMTDSVADLPPVRSFADLSPDERAKVAQMTGYSVEEIEANLSEIDYGNEEADVAFE